MTALLLIAFAWMALALPFGLLLGRGMRLADQRELRDGATGLVPDFIPADMLASVAAQQRRRL